MITLENDSIDGIELEELTDDGTVVGRAVIEPNGRVAWLGLEIAPEARGRHLGRQLLTRALVTAREHDLDVVRLSFDRGDIAALRLVRGCDHVARIHAAGASCIAEIAVRPSTETRDPR